MLDNQFLQEYLDAPEGQLIVRFKDYDGRSALFKKMRKLGCLELCTKESVVQSLRGFVLKKATQKGFCFEDVALDLFLQRLDYAENEEVNLFTVLGYMKSLSALGKVVTQEMVCTVVPAHFNENVFGIARMIVAGDVDGLKVQASLLGGDVIRTLSALLREYRIAYKSRYFSSKEIGAFSNVFSHKDKASLVRGMDLITGQIASVKHGTFPGEIVLMETFLRLINI